MKPTREEVLRLMRQASGGILTQVAEDPRCGYEIKVEELQTFAALLQAQASNECGSVPDEQAAFEAHIRMISPKRLFIERWPDGSYKHIEIEVMWKGWQARAALGMQPPNNQPNSDHIAVTSAEPEASVPDIQWRKLLAITYCGFPALYCDDGELQDNRAYPSIDFKRDSVDEIWDKMRSRTTSAIQSGISSLDRRPNEKTFADKTGTFADTSNCFVVQTEQPSLSDEQVWDIYVKATNAVMNTGGRTFAIALTRAILAQRQDSEQSRLMLADDTSPRIPQRQDSNKEKP